MLDNLVVERFREGHNNIELCLYPSTGLQDLIGACVRFETHVELGTRSYKPNKGMYTAKGNDSADLSFDEVARAARKLGYALRPWVERQENRQQENRGQQRLWRTQSLPEQRRKPPTSSQIQPERKHGRVHTKSTSNTYRRGVGHVESWDIMPQTVPRLAPSSLSRQRWSE